MNIIAHGIDLVDCDRLAASVERLGEKFLEGLHQRAGLLPGLFGRPGFQQSVLADFVKDLLELLLEVFEQVSERRVGREGLDSGRYSGCPCSGPLSAWESGPSGWD